MFGCKDLHKHIHGRSLYENLSFCVGAGQGVALLGPSGVGKSTLLRTLALLEPAESGSIYLNNRTWPSAIAEQGFAELAPQVGLMLQHCAVWPHLTLEENIMFPFAGRADEAQIHAHVLALCTRLDLVRALCTRASRASGGERQRAALVRVLAANPKVLLLDEPTSHLDEVLAARVQALLEEQKEDGKAIILCTHNPSFASVLCEKSLLLREGASPVFAERAEKAVQAA